MQTQTINHDAHAKFSDRPRITTSLNTTVNVNFAAGELGAKDHLLVRASVAARGNGSDTVDGRVIIDGQLMARIAQTSATTAVNLCLFKIVKHPDTAKVRYGAGQRDGLTTTGGYEITSGDAWASAWTLTVQFRTDQGAYYDADFSVDIIIVRGAS